MDDPAVQARVREAWEQGVREHLAARARRTPEEVEAEAAEQRLRTANHQAAIICRARANMAATQPAFGGFGMAGAIIAGVQLGWAAANVEAACLAAYQGTGIMPTY